MPVSSFVVKAGSSSVPVYVTNRTVAGRLYPLFTVCHYTADGKRVRQSFGDESKARAEADRLAKAMSRGQSQAVSFTAGDADIYAKAVRILAPSGASIIEACLDYARRHPSGAPRVTVQTVADEVVHDAEVRKLSDAHTRDLRHRLDKFAEAFPDTMLADLTTEQIRAWIRALPLSARSKRNHQAGIVSLFAFARRRKYVGKEIADEVADLERVKVKTDEPGTLTPAELRKILDVAGPEHLPGICIAAFTGLRTAELCRLTWDAVKLDQRLIVVAGDVAKTASRRTVPMSDNLLEWLATVPAAQRVGLVAVNGMRLTELVKEAGIKWPKNALRHSAVSYKVALDADVVKAAAESGNSPAIIHKHYRALVTEAAAKEWFDVRPQPVAGVVPFTAVP